jgi:protein SCO1
MPSHTIPVAMDARDRIANHGLAMQNHILPRRPKAAAPRLRLMAMLLTTIAALGLGACGRDNSSAKTAEAAKRDNAYPLTGEVLSADPAHKTIRVRHDEVKGLMPAMTMDFPASAGDVATVKPGERIRADLVRTPAGEFRLERIWPDDTVAKDTVAAVARQLREDTNDRGNHAYREVGETVPSFALYDQTGRVVQSARFRGKQIILNFIYTRCPIATMCPAATIKMMQTQKLAREAGVKNLELVSITLDPTYDTPGVLKEYAETRGIDTSNFSFLTGPENAIKDLLTQFGVIAEFDGDLVKHTLTTLLVNEDGKIIYRADGSQWEPKEFVAKMHKA